MTDADAKVVREEVRQAIMTALYEFECGLEGTMRSEVRPLAEGVSRTLVALCRRWGMIRP